MLPTAETTFPITISTGPIAAGKEPYGDDGVLGALVHAVQLVNESLHPCDDLADGGHEDFTKGNGKLLQLAFQNGKLPGRLSCMVAAISADFPSQFAMALLTFSMSAGAAFISARKPDMAFFPTSASAAAAFSDSDSCRKPSGSLPGWHSNPSCCRPYWWWHGDLA